MPLVPRRYRARTVTLLAARKYGLRFTRFRRDDACRRCQLIFRYFLSSTFIISIRRSTPIVTFSYKRLRAIFAWLIAPLSLLMLYAARDYFGPDIRRAFEDELIYATILYFRLRELAIILFSIFPPHNTLAIRVFSPGNISRCAVVSHYFCHACFTPS